MKKVICFCCMLLLSLATRAQYTSLPIGSNAPFAEIKMKDISGTDISLQQAMRGNGLLVMFSCNTCPYVIKNKARTKELAAFARQNNIGVLLLNSNEGGRNSGDSYADMQAYAKEQGYDFHYAVDAGSKLADAFGATRTPEVFLFNSGGKLVYKGAIDDNPADAGNVTRTHAKEAITEIVAGRPVSVKESRSVGCGIKRG